MRTFGIKTQLDVSKQNFLSHIFSPSAYSFRVLFSLYFFSGIPLLLMSFSTCSFSSLLFCFLLSYPCLSVLSSLSSSLWIASVLSQRYLFCSVFLCIFYISLHLFIFDPPRFPALSFSFISRPPAVLSISLLRSILMPFSFLLL